MWRGSKIGAVLACVVAGVFACCPLPDAASAASFAVQPDEKIVLSGDTWPQFGALARLLPDGSLDPSFGQGGFVLDQRAPSFAALALAPDNGIVAAAAGGSVLARYRPDGSPDLGFGQGGIGGFDDPRQSHSAYEAEPVSVLVQPAGTIVMAEQPSAGRLYAEGQITQYDAHGNLLGIVGRVPPPPKPGAPSAIADVVEAADGALLGAGWRISGQSSLPLLGRFVPGSGLDFDPGFGGGAGLVQPSFPEKHSFSNAFEALAASGGKLIAAGRADGTFLVARFDANGILDPGFGEGGFAVPPIAGTSTFEVGGGWGGPSSWAEAVAAAPDGDVLAAGGTSAWGTWTSGKSFPACSACPQPMLARFDSSGRLDPSFGQGGLLRLTKPGGGLLEGELEGVVTLADGRILVKGTEHSATGPVPFIARLGPDGTYDPSFGAGGMVSLEFPCTDQGREVQVAAGCVASAAIKLRLRGLRRQRPSIYLRLAANPGWAAIGSVFLTLPRGLLPTRKLGHRLRIETVGGSARGRVHVSRTIGSPIRQLIFNGFGNARVLRIQLRPGSLATVGRRARERRKVKLRVKAWFTHATWGTDSGQQHWVRDVG